MEKVITHEGKDISHLKIYKDGENYRKQHFCRSCKALVGCFCYEDLSDAIESCRFHWFCNKHFILDAINEDVDIVQEIPALMTPEVKSIFAQGEWDCDEAESVQSLIKIHLETLLEQQIKEIYNELSELIDVDTISGELCNL